jgi:16S rRNA (cytosine1402-N4)-methyltransferase
MQKNNSNTQPPASRPQSHIPVLLKETIEGLGLKSGETLVDATFGLGGHSLLACQSINNLRIIGIELNNDTRIGAQASLKEQGCKVETFAENFRNLDKVLARVGLQTADKYIFDLGWSSQELAESGRGFSFMRDEALLMTYKDAPTTDDLTARDIVNTWQKENIEAVLAGFGEERYASKIAQAIVETRRKKEIKTTFDLVDIIRTAVPVGYTKQKLHFATRVFQALRIATNDEIESLKEALAKAFEHLNKDGRIAVISFHSLEDRIVKNYFRELKKEDKAEIFNKKPIVPTREEIKTNPRSRSAKLRILQKK